MEKNLNKYDTERQKKSQNTRKKIFNASLNLLKNYGYEYLTIKNICEEAQVSNGTFFHYFKNKDELLSQYFEEGYILFAEECAKNPKNDDIRQETIDHVCFYLKYCTDQGLEFLSNYYSAKNKSIATTIDSIKFMQTTARDLALAQEKGYIKADASPEKIVEDICFFSKGLIFEWCIYEGNTDILSRCNYFVGMFMDTFLTEKYWETYPKK